MKLLGGNEKEKFASGSRLLASGKSEICLSVGLNKRDCYSKQLKSKFKGPRAS